jgi:hypothetical protein
MNFFVNSGWNWSSVSGQKKPRCVKILQTDWQRTTGDQKSSLQLSTQVCYTCGTTVSVYWSWAAKADNIGVILYSSVLHWENIMAEIKGKSAKKKFCGNNNELTTCRRGPALTNFLITNLQKYIILTIYTYVQSMCFFFLFHIS